jgi:hypothetical protein
MRALDDKVSNLSIRDKSGSKTKNARARLVELRIQRDQWSEVFAPSTKGSSVLTASEQLEGIRRLAANKETCFVASEGRARALRLQTSSSFAGGASNGAFLVAQYRHCENKRVRDVCPSNKQHSN